MAVFRRSNLHHAPTSYDNGPIAPGHGDADGG